MPTYVQPSFVLSVEREELGITAGLQDRVIQVYEGLVYMDFSKEKERTEHGYVCYEYEPLPLEKLPRLYVAWHDGLSEPTEVFHNDIGGRYRRGEKKVVDAMEQFAGIAAEGREALLASDHERLAWLIDENFNLRERIARLPDWQRQMVYTARECGASAKFAGSGGAIVGTWQDEAMLAELTRRLARMQVHTIVPQI